MKKSGAFFANLDSGTGISLLSTVIFFVIVLGWFHPSYYIIDDPKIIWTASGYIGGKAVPFLIYSNVLLGLILLPLYRLGMNINWEIWFFIGINFLSVWSLIHSILSTPIDTGRKIAGTAVVLACDAYFILNITYTMIAALACSAGMCAMLVSTKSSDANRKGFLTGAVLLAFIAGLIRIQMFALIVCITLSTIIFIHHSLDHKRLIAAILSTIILTGSSYLLDRLYVRVSPDWNMFYKYTYNSQLIHDTNRLANMHATIRNVGWSNNDQELFAHWFFSDPGTFSFERLQYLVNTVPGTTTDMPDMISAFFNHLLNPPIFAYLLMLLSIWLWIVWNPPTPKVIFSILVSQLVFIAANLYLVWAWKIADWVVLSGLVCIVLLDTTLLYRFGWEASSPSPAEPQTRLVKRLLYAAPVLSLIAAGWFVISQSLKSAADNQNKQSAYHEILDDLKNLQRSGKISQDALIVSPAHGLPLEWANPLTLEFPSMQYMDMGWITFSPAYDRVLEKFDIQFLPDALYEKNNVYLMGRSNFTTLLNQYYQEHENISVSFQIIYNMPNTHGFDGYDDIHLYKVLK